MVDFGHCHIHRNGETNLELDRANYSKDEEGAIGLTIHMILKRDFALSWATKAPNGL